MPLVFCVSARVSNSNANAKRVMTYPMRWVANGPWLSIAQQFQYRYDNSDRHEAAPERNRGDDDSRRESVNHCPHAYDCCRCGDVLDRVPTEEKQDSGCGEEEN